MILPAIRPVLVRLVAVAVLLAAVGVLSPARALAGPAVSISPTSSYAYDTFILSGTGFPVGTNLKPTFTDPSGNTGTVTDSYGNNATVGVANDGTWQLSVQPGSAFHSTATGTYHVSLCQSDSSSTCWSLDLKVSNDVPGMSGGGAMGGY